MTTTNLGMTIPTVGADTDNWGNDLNTDLQKIDDAFTVNRFTDFTNTLTFTAPPNGSLTMGGYGSSWKLTPARTGTVRIHVTGYITPSGPTCDAVFNVRYGTGMSPSQSAAVTGSGGTTMDYLATSGSNDHYTPFTMTYDAVGLALGTPYWFDVCMRAINASAIITPCSIIIEEIF